MGLFSFIKSAGRVLGLGHDATQDESKPAPPTPSADAIKAELQNQGFGGPGLDVQVQGDTVALSGNAPDAETREKMILAAGNIAGVSGVQESINTSAPAAEPRFYTVQKGDTLSAIAQRMLGSANKYPAIFEANRPMLADPNKIYPGQVLRIPAG